MTPRQGQVLRRLPERRDGDGRRARRARGLPLGRAPEALHDARHGHRPGQDLERHGHCADGGADVAHDRRDRHDDLPPALHAGRDRARSPAMHRGKDFRPTRLPPSHRWAHGARRRRSSRPARGCARSGSRAPARPTGSTPVSREVRAVRSAVGICDVSTLGKIDVQGPDAATFLDRLYANNFRRWPSAGPATASCCAKTAS